MCRVLSCVAYTSWTSPFAVVHAHHRFVVFKMHILGLEAFPGCFGESSLFFLIPLAPSFLEFRQLFLGDAVLEVCGAVHFAYFVYVLRKCADAGFFVYLPDCCLCGIFSRFCLSSRDRLLSMRAPGCLVKA